MANSKITVDQLAEFMQRELPMTYDVFEKNRHQDREYNTASWARGRVDAFLEIMQLIDEDREAMLRAEWKRVVTGEGFTKDEDDA